MAVYKNMASKFFNTFKKRPEDFILIFFAITLIVIVAGIFSTIFGGKNKPNIPNGQAVLNTPTPTSNRSRFILFDKKGGEDLAEKLINRKKLSDEDLSVKKGLLNTILKGESSGVLYSSKNVQIEYMESLDLFMAEILTPDISNAKTEANTWLRDQGLSQEAICNIPLMFYLNQEVIRKNQGRDILFRPLSPEC
jgi:hypothetical protein